MSDENKNGSSGNDKKDAGSSCCIEPIFVIFIIFACVTVILTWLFCLPVKRIIEQFSNEHCVHTFVLIIIILCVLSAGYIITLLCIRKHFICLLNIHRTHRMNEINRMNQPKQISTNDSDKKDPENSTYSHSTNQSDKTEQNVAKCNDCNKQDDVSVQITLGVQNSIDVHKNKNN